jgi:hypothetical protein
MDMDQKNLAPSGSAGAWNMAGETGFEPATCGFGVRCSTN